MLIFRQGIRWIHRQKPKNRGEGHDCSEETAVFQGGERVEGTGGSLNIEVSLCQIPLHHMNTDD